MIAYSSKSFIGLEVALHCGLGNLLTPKYNHVLQTMILLASLIICLTVLNQLKIHLGSDEHGYFKHLAVLL